MMFWLTHSTHALLWSAFIENISLSVVVISRCFKVCIEARNSSIVIKLLHLERTGFLISDWAANHLQPLLDALIYLTFVFPQSSDFTVYTYFCNLNVDV